MAKAPPSETSVAVGVLKRRARGKYSWKPTLL
jgi:hypothetical protein